MIRLLRCEDAIDLKDRAYASREEVVLGKVVLIGRVDCEDRAEGQGIETRFWKWLASRMVGIKMNNFFSKDMKMPPRLATSRVPVAVA